MATWSDFQAPAQQDVTSTTWTTLNNNVQQHGLILAWAAHYDPYGSSPTVKLSGVPLHVVLELPIQPYRTWFPYDHYYWYYSVYGVYPPYYWLAAYYYYGYYYWWVRYWYWWWSGRWRVTGTLVIAFADAAGTVSMEALGAQCIIQKLRIWQTQLNPGENQAITRVNFQRSDTTPLYPVSRYSGQMQVTQDDIVVLMGLNYDFLYNQLSLGDIVAPSPPVQVLLNEVVARNVWPYGSLIVRVVRVKGNGTLYFTWGYAHAGVAAIRLTPNVEERTVTFPSLPPDEKLYFELQVIEDAFGNHNYPREFLALVESLKHRPDWGQFQSWKREEVAIVRDDQGREVFSGWKFVEFWMVPQSYYSQVQAIPNVLILETFQKMAARKKYHDERW